MGENNLIVKFDSESILKLCKNIETKGQIKIFFKKNLKEIFL